MGMCCPRIAHVGQHTREHVQTPGGGNVIGTVDLLIDRDSPLQQLPGAFMLARSEQHDTQGRH